MNFTLRDSIHVIKSNRGRSEGLESLQFDKLAETGVIVGIELADVVCLLTMNKDIARCMLVEHEHCLKIKNLAQGFGI